MAHIIDDGITYKMGAGPSQPVRGSSGLGAQPTAWIIEKPGYVPTLTHYQTVANTAQNHGCYVTPYYSKVTK